jgi:hypothetical protein
MFIRKADVNRMKRPRGASLMLRARAEVHVVDGEPGAAEPSLEFLGQSDEGRYVAIVRKKPRRERIWYLRVVWSVVLTFQFTTC